nr:glycerophosphodiester phosphodiesterase [Nesterenkonia lacusekhoensis]
MLNSRPGAAGSVDLHHSPLAFVHRGGDPARENTMAAFEAAVAMGYRYLEIDVRTSSDGVLVVFHDETLERITDGTGPLSEKTWQQLAGLRLRASGEPLLRFEELLTRWEDVHLNVDLKDGASVDEFARLVEAHGAHDRVLAASFNDARRHRVRRALSRRVATSGGWVVTALIVLLGPLGLMQRLGRRSTEIDCVQVPISQGRIRVVTPGFVRRCHRAGLQVHVWVVDEPEEMRRLLDMGVDGLMTDDAAALAQFMAERDGAVWPQR